MNKNVQKKPTSLPSQSNVRNNVPTSLSRLKQIQAAMTTGKQIGPGLICELTSAATPATIEPATLNQDHLVGKKQKMVIDSGWKEHR